MIMKRMNPMQYEIYADSLFLINFVMNLYVLMLVNHRTNGTATPLRLLGASALGAMGYLLILWIPGTALLKIILGVSAESVGTILFAFRVKGLRNFVKVLEKTLVYSFCLGGGFLFAIRCFQLTGGMTTCTFGILGIGGLVYLFLRTSPDRETDEQPLCQAIFKVEEAQITVNALIDSGNSLSEPISGKPVSVVDEQIFRVLWKDETAGFRVVPYHSIGRKHGILKAYLLPELKLEIGGMQKIIREVYVAVSPEPISSGGETDDNAVKMIINPLLLTKKLR